MSTAENKGALFTNNRKQKETHPDFKGEINVNGKKYDLSGWKKQGQNGAFISLSIQEPYIKPNEVQKNDLDDFLNNF